MDHIVSPKDGEKWVCDGNLAERKKRAAGIRWILVEKAKVLLIRAYNRASAVQAAHASC